jgi:hypothetical protein
VQKSSLGSLHGQEREDSLNGTNNIRKGLENVQCFYEIKGSPMLRVFLDSTCVWQTQILQGCNEKVNTAKCLSLTSTYPNLLPLCLKSS